MGGGGGVSMVSKNWKLFVARLSGFWLRKILLDHPKKKIIPARTKKMEGMNGPDPLPPRILCGTVEFGLHTSYAEHSCPAIDGVRHAHSQYYDHVLQSGAC
jgi:hypothetical protein